MGGTWCGVNVKSGDICMLTNAWSNKLNPVEKPITRGYLVSHFLTKEEKDFTYLKKDYDKYQGFNLIYGNVFDPKSFIYESNRTETIPQKKQMPIEKPLSDGIHVVTNSFINDTTWPKTEILTNELKKLVEGIKEKEISVEELKDKISTLMCLRPSPTKFPNYSDIQPEKFTESDLDGIGNIFVKSEETQTRSQIILIVDKNQNVNYFYANTDHVKVNKDEKIVHVDKSLYKQFTFKKD